MNRLQKKCVIVSAGIHFLLLVVLLVGPAFVSPRPKGSDLHVLDFIPANLIDAPFNNPGAGAAPAPAVAPAPPPPAPEIAPPPPPPPLPERSEIPDLKPDKKPTASQPPRHQISTQLVTRTAPKGSATDAARARALAIQNAIKRLKTGLSSGTGTGSAAGTPGGGGSGEAYANYRDVVYSVYNQAWTLPAIVINEDVNTKVSVLIARDGTVLNARIITPSGDANVDASVQQTLERVTYIAPFPKGATEKERTYTINFNPKVRRMLE